MRDEVDVLRAVREAVEEQARLDEVELRERVVRADVAAAAAVVDDVRHEQFGRDVVQRHADGQRLPHVAAQHRLKS